VKLIMKNFGALIFVLVVSLCVNTVANAKDGDSGHKKNTKGKKFQILQTQIDANKVAIDNIELTPGPKGDKGDQGIQGEKGNTGATGDQGIQGVAGNNGAVGATGPQGPIGLTGADGQDGIDGGSLFDHPWTQFGTDVYYEEGNVGIGTMSPDAKLDVHGISAIFGDGDNTINQDTGIQFHNSLIAHVGFRFDTTNNQLVYEDASDSENPTTWYSGAARNFIVRNGNVGIGTTSPVDLLHVKGNTQASIRLEDSDGQTYQIGSGDNGLGGAFNIAHIGAGVRFTINTSGNVGIGTTTPEWKLHVAGAHPLLIDNTGSPFNDSILFRRFGVNQYTLGVTNEPSLDIFDQVAQAFRFTIRSNGNVGISDQTPSERLSVGGNIRATGTITQGSSRELKENITVISTVEATETLNGLNPVKFKYKAEDSGEEHLGFIAEDVPDLVAFKDRKRLSSMDMTAVLVRVVQEQQRVINEQQKIMDTMTQEIQKIKLAMNTL
jgi:hypothetical protein